MREIQDEEGAEERPLDVLPSSFVTREEMQSGFRNVRRILWLFMLLTTIESVGLLLFSGGRSTIVALSSDGHMRVLSRLSDTLYRKNFERIVRYFATSFLTNLTAYDSFEISYRLEKALMVMTPELRVRMKREIISQNLVESVQKARIHTVLSLKDLSLHRVGRGIWSATVTGERRSYPYGQGGGQSKGFSAQILLRRGGVTVFNPYGLWVENYREESTRPEAGILP